MNEQEYYKQIKELIETYEVNSKVRYMRQFYLLFPIYHSVSDKLTWTHYRYLLPIKNESERNYYINQVVLNNLSVRELRELIKSKAYNRLSFKDKENIKLIENNNKNNLTIEDIYVTTYKLII